MVYFFEMLKLHGVVYVLQSGFKVRVYNETDSERAIKLISDIIVNEFNFKLDPDNLDSCLRQYLYHTHNFFP
jgi:acylphosphatase